MHPAYNQEYPDNPELSEDPAYPAAPDSEYSWEKLFSERVYLAFKKNYGLNVRIARFHNIFGPEGTWTGGREKSPAAFCRKVAETPDGGEIEMWVFMVTTMWMVFQQQHSWYKFCESSLIK